MLRPHAIELDWLLRSQPGLSTPISKQAFADRARHYLRERGIEHVMAELREVTMRPVTLEKREDDFVSILQENAGSAFAAIEFINGSWPKRLRRLYDSGTLSFSELGPEMRELLSAGTLV